MTSESFINSILSIIEDNTSDPTLFFNVQDKAAKSFKRATKILYDFTKKKTDNKAQSLPELIIDGFDEEQIWQQIELQNDHVIPTLIADISKLLSNKQLTQPLEFSDDLQSKKMSEGDENDDDDDDDDEAEMSDEEFDDKLNSAEENSASESESANTKSKMRTTKRKQEPSIVDDKFFKIQELNEYLNTEDRKESKSLSKTKVTSDDEFVDLFNDFSDDEDENEETQNARLVKYADFFDSPESDGEGENNHEQSQQEGNISNEEEEELESNHGEFMENSEEQTSPAAKRVKFNLPLDSEESNESDDNSEKLEKQKLKSSLEERQERINKKIKVLEEEAISEKPWQLKGEVSASNRPQNSLLEDFVEVDVVSRPPPIITEQCTLDLEDIIRQRIKDKAWDDVEKKIKPVETPTEYKKKLIMDQEKSKLSLAEIYEKEYVKQKQALDPEQNTEEAEPKEHIEIKEMMHSVMKKLDALSNYHYTPIPAKPELKIVSNVPAVSMEEVAPVSTSDATLLAPEEVHAKKRGDYLGKGERTKTDKKREVRKRKKKQREIQEAKEAKEKLKAVSEVRKKRNKQSAKAVEKLTKSRNVIKMDEKDHKTTKSSTAFFNQLQDEVQSLIKIKSSKKPEKKDKSRISAIKLKL